MQLEALRDQTREVAALVEHLRELCGDDDQALVDTLDGSSDAVEAARRVVRWVHEQSAQASACKELAAVYSAREKTFTDRIARGRTALLTFMQELGLRSMPLPEGTVIVSAGKPSLNGETDPAALPDDLVRIKREPDKTAIRAALEAGREVPGYALGNATPTLSIRVK